MSDPAPEAPPIPESEAVLENVETSSGKKYTKLPLIVAIVTAVLAALGLWYMMSRSTRVVRNTNSSYNNAGRALLNPNNAISSANISSRGGYGGKFNSY